MDTDRLRYFSAIARTGSLTSASRLLGVSPAALSKSMKALEAELGEKLLVPSGRGIAVTERGREVAREAEQIVERVRGLARREAPAARARLRLGSFEVFTTYFLGRALSGPLRGMAVDAHELLPGAIEDAVARGAVDLGLTYLPMPRPEVEFTRLSRVEMAVFGRPGLRGWEVASLPFVVPIAPLEGGPTRARGLDGWPDDAAPRTVVHRVTLLETALELCRRGLAVAHLPRFLVELHNARAAVDARLVAVAATAGPRADPQWVHLVRRRGAVESRAERALARAVREICA